MSQIKISQLPQLPSISSNTSNSLFLGVDLPSGITGKFTATTLAQQLYANNYLTVGNNQIVFPNTVAQFSGYDPNFLQINMQNFTSSGSGDYIVTADIGTQTTGYIDLGIQGSTNYDSANASAYYPLDGYLYVQGGAATQGGNLIVGTGTTGTHIKFTVGGSNNSNTVAHMYSNGTATFANNVIFGGNLIFSDGTTQNSSSYSAGIYANTAFQYANSAGSYANSAFVKANNALANTTGTFAGELSITQTLRMLTQGGDEGGEIFLNKAVTNTTINNGVTIDVYRNKIRFFEQGGTARGAYIDITEGGAGVATNLLSPSYNALSDVVITSPTNQQIVVYNSSTSIWENKDPIVATGLAYKPLYPNNKTATGILGQICIDGASGTLYVCTGTNTWQKVSMNSANFTNTGGFN